MSELISLNARVAKLWGLLGSGIAANVRSACRRDSDRAFYCLWLNRTYTGDWKLFQTCQIMVQSGVKSVLFDLDGTLLNREASVEQFIAVQYDRLTAHLSHISKIDYATRFIELDCHGHVWKDKVYQTLVTKFAIGGISWQALLNDYETQFQFNCVPFNFLVEMLNRLKQQGYLLGIVTNGLGEFQTRSIKGLGIQNYFDVILISEVEQVRKPQLEIFQRAMNRLGVAAQDSVFVGDHPEADILGAKRAKMRTIWKRSLYWDEAKEADAIIGELNEIPLILQQFESN